MDWRKIDSLKAKLDGYRPLPPEIVNNLHEDLVLRWTYHTNAIEGNTFTLKETKVALEGITVGGKTLREHLEAINHSEAILFVEELVRKKHALTQWHIKSLHGLILKGIDDAQAGRYRSLNVIVSGATHRPPDHLVIADKMDGFMHWYASEAQALHPVERAARVHADFVKIHPFADGNGRTSRLLMNFELMQAGFPPAVLPVDKRLLYYEALDQAHVQGEYAPFLDLIADVVEQSFEPYWFALGIDPE